MKTIVAGKSNLIRLLGKQVEQETEYRLMNYVLRTTCDDGILLHNSLTGHLVLLDEEEALFLDDLPALRTAAVTELIENHFLVPTDYDEKDTVLSMRALVKRLEVPKGIESYTILTTTNCNARCFYCYESELPKLNMDETTASKLVDYMIQHREGKTLKLHWFGGEPLVCLNRIDQVCNALKTKDVQYISTMTSNGYLFDDEVVEKATALWKLDSVQITLDGTEDVYNRTKAYVGNGENPYKRVLKNIRLLLLHSVRVIIRLNLDQHNADDLMALISELNDTIGSNEKLEVYSHVLFENAGFSPIKRDEDRRAMLYARQVELNRTLESLRLSKSHRALPFLKSHCCMADTDNATVVYPDGRLFKCEHVNIGDEYGNVDVGIINRAGIERFQSTIELEACSQCPIFPSCILLQNCQGALDKNIYTCKYEVERARRTLIKYYQNNKIDLPT